MHRRPFLASLLAALAAPMAVFRAKAAPVVVADQYGLWGDHTTLLHREIEASLAKWSKNTGCSGEWSVNRSMIDTTKETNQRCEDGVLCATQRVGRQIKITLTLTDESNPGDLARSEYKRHLQTEDGFIEIIESARVPGEGTDPIPSRCVVEGPWKPLEFHRESSDQFRAINEFQSQREKVKCSNP